LRLSLCNEVIRELEFARQCAYAAELGYAGLELAPFTFGADAYLMGSEARAAIRRALADAGIAASGLHWLLVSPAGLSITTEDPAIRERTSDVLNRLVDLCADLGGQYLVHGSPAQRRIGGDDPRAAAERGEEMWAAIAERARNAGVTYCIEPLASPGADFINTVAEAAAIVRRIGNPALRTMIDSSAAFRMEPQPLADVVTQWLPTGLIAHVQLNDSNGRAPGQGRDQFAPVLRPLREGGYEGWIAIEPFEYVPDGPGCAARAIGYVAGILESIDAAS
jgi:D-psicose/D-tagatose/L-ribulose 3-epimerase